MGYLIDWPFPQFHQLHADHAPSLYLALAWVAFLRAGRDSPWVVALLSLPGTVLHELMHFSVGWFLGARPVSFNVVPERVGRRWVLGSVGFARINLLNGAPVAFAPLLMLPLGWIFLERWMMPAWASGDYGEWLLAGYIAGCCVFACLPSGADIRLGASSAVLWACIGCGLYFWSAA